MVSRDKQDILKAEPQEDVGSAAAAGTALSQHAMQIQMSDKDLNTRDKVQLGNWLEHNFRKLENAQYKDEQISGNEDPHIPDGSISLADLTRTYKDGVWKDGSPLAHRDQLMLRQAIEHFNQVAPGGTFSLAIDRFDVDRLKHGAKATAMSDGSVVTHYGDGTNIVSKDDKVQVKRPDGTIEYATAGAHMVLHPNGHGSLLVTSYQDAELPAQEQPAMDLQRQTDGSWQGTDPSGNVFNFLMNKDVARGTVNGEVAYQLDKNGVLYRGDEGEVITGDKNGVVFGGNTKDRMSWQRDALNQVQAIRTPNGDVNTEYGGGVAGVIEHSNGSRTVYWENSSDTGPLVEISKDNQLTLRDEKGEPQIILSGDDGVQSASAGDANVTLDPDGRVTIAYKVVSETQDDTTGKVEKTSYDRSFTLGKDGKYKGPNNEGAVVELDPVVPPPLT